MPSAVALLCRCITQEPRAQQLRYKWREQREVGYGGGDLEVGSESVARVPPGAAGILPEGVGKGKVRSIRLGGGWSWGWGGAQSCWGSTVRTRRDGLKDEDLSFNPTTEERGGIWGSWLRPPKSRENHLGW